MNPQFLLCTNPNMPEQGEYILHNKSPRFLAKVINNGQELSLFSKIDEGDDSLFTGKLSRALDWYRSLPKKK